MKAAQPRRRWPRAVTAVALFLVAVIAVGWRLLSSPPSSLPAPPIPVHVGTPLEVAQAPTGEIGFRPVELLDDNGKPVALDKLRRCLPSASGVDVLFGTRAIYLMSEPGRVREIWSAPPGSDDVDPRRAVYDGRYVWSSLSQRSARPQLIVIDPLDETLMPLVSADSLPGEDEKLAPGAFSSLAIAPLGPGKVCLAWGIPGWTWLGIASFEREAGGRIKVFHTARDAPSAEDAEQWRSTKVAFMPECAFTLAGASGQRVLIGRRSGVNRDLIDRPLLVDPAQLTVEVAALKTGSALRDSSVRDGALFTLAPLQPGTQSVLRVPFPGTTPEILVAKARFGPFTYQDGRAHVLEQSKGNWWTARSGDAELRVGGKLPEKTVVWLDPSHHYGLLVLGRTDRKHSLRRVTTPEGSDAVARIDKPAPPARKETRPRPAVAQAARRSVSELVLLPKGPGGKSVALLSKPAEPNDPKVLVPRPLLRELVRQALLLAAREEHGLTTLDPVLGEGPTEPAAAAPALRLSLAASDNTVQVQLGPRDADPLCSVALAVSNDSYADLVQRLENLTRTEFARALATLDGAAAAGRARSGAAIPAAALQRLNRLDVLSHFAALRELHAAVRADGESPQLLGGLVRGYANLGVLSEFHWSVAHQVYRARALLYGQRLIAAHADSAWARWHRAYAWALVGQPALALQDLAAAANAAGAEKPPAWVAVIDAYCRFDGEALDRLAQDDVAETARLLSFLSVEHPTPVSHVLSKGWSMLQANPECYRVHDGMAAIGGVAARHKTTMAPLAILEQVTPRRLLELPDLPAAAAAVLRAAGAAPWHQSEARVLDVLHRAPIDGELAWSSLAALLRETRFVQLARRARFLRIDLGVPLGEFLATALPLVADHPFRDYLAAQGLEGVAQVKAMQAALSRFPLRDIGPGRQNDLLRDLLTFDPARGYSMANWAAQQTEPLQRDLNVLVIHGGADPVLSAERLHRISPHSPVARARLIERDWTRVEKDVPLWQKEAPTPLVLAALANHYSAEKQWAEAQRYWRQLLRLSPDHAAYVNLANVYLAQGNSAQWLATMEESLQAEDNGLDHARARVAIANHYLGQREWHKARPYADAAAESWAEWAMRCASECHEALENWDESEKWAIRVGQRYPDGHLDWFLWCTRTGRGDADAARRVCEQRFAQLGDQLTAPYRVQLGLYQAIAGRPEQALDSFLTSRRQQASDELALLIVVLADALGRAEVRAQMTKELNAQPRPLCQLAGLLGTAGPAALDLKKADDLMAKMNHGDRAVASYAVGRFLAEHGQPQQARPYLNRCADDILVSRVYRTLAILSLRKLETRAPN